MTAMFFKLISVFKNWKGIVISQLLNREMEPVLKLRNGIQFYTNKNILDVVVILENFAGANDHDYFKIVNLSRKPIIIDIGAHIGTFSVNAAKKYPQARIFSFEPDELNYDKLIKNIKVNNVQNVVPYHKAVGTTNGTILLYSNNYGNFGTCSSSSITTGPRSIEVPSITLENIFKENQIEECDLLKMDCEGGEYDIILRSNEDVFKKIRTIALEYHIIEEHKVEDIVSFLKNNGYQILLRENKFNNNFGFIYANKYSELKKSSLTFDRNK